MTLGSVQPGCMARASPAVWGMEGAAGSGSEWPRQWAVPKSPPFGWSQVGGGRRGTSEGAGRG